jgi:hypothetical protein
LASNDGLQYLVEPFPEGMDEVGAVGTDWVSAEGALVDFNGKVEIPKWVRPALLYPVSDIIDSIFGKVLTQFVVFSRPLINLFVEITRRSLG